MYRFPAALAADIAVATLRAEMSEDGAVAKVLLVAFGEDVAKELERALRS